MAIWPTTLPGPRGSGFSVKPVDQVIRTDMDAGNVRTRRRTTARNDRITASWQMSDAQYSAFRTWFDDGATGAAGGSAWFTISLPIGTTGVQVVTARFYSPFQASYLDGFYWNVSAELEVR